MVVIGVLGISTYNFITHKKTEPLQQIMTNTEQGVDVAIENFKVIHENSGRKEWELIAKSAKVNQKEKITYMNGVNVTVDLENDQKYWISADKGTLQNETQDFVLEGNVRLIAKAEAVAQKVKKLNKKLN